MKVSTLLSALVAALALGWGPQLAAEPPLTLTLGTGPQEIFDDERAVDYELVPFGAAEFRFSQHWAAEFWYASGETDGDNGFGRDIDRWHLDALYYLKPLDKLHPYLAFGGGQLKREWDVPNGHLDRVDEEFNGGAGGHYFLTDNLSLRGDARYLFGTDDDTSKFTLSVGLAYRFGGSPWPTSRPTPAPVPAPEPARLDSDGDGVYDDQDDCPETAAGVRVDNRGCEITVTRVASVKLKVHFAFDKDVVEEHYFADLKGLAEFLQRFEDMHVDIKGHTDSAGTDAYNLALSQRRANAVMEMLKHKYGIAAYRLEVTGYGESQPVASNETAAGRAENRRVMATLEVEYPE